MVAVLFQKIVENYARNGELRQNLWYNPLKNGSCHLNSLCVRKSTTLMVMRSSRDKFTRFVAKLAKVTDCLVPRRLSFDEKVCAKEGGKETTGETRFACRLYPSHGPLRFITSHSFRARLCHAKNVAPEEEAEFGS